MPNKGSGRAIDTTSGVSETIGAILLVGLVVAAVALIGIFLFSQQTPTKLPNLNFMVGTNSPPTLLYLYHNGGDTMTAGEFSVLVDGVQKPYSISDASSQWSLGKNLIVSISQAPQNVQIVYNSSGSQPVLLRSGSAAVANYTRNITPDQIPYLDCSAVKNWDCADQIPPDIVLAQYMKNTSAKKINLMKFDQGVGAIVGGPGYHFNVTIGDPNSTMILGLNTCLAGNQEIYNLATGDWLNVTFYNGNPNDFTIYGMAPQIWEMAGGNAANLIIDLSYASNGSRTRFTGRRLCHTYISKYSGYNSTLTVTTDNTAKVTALIVNESHVIERANTTIIRLNNLRPTDNGLFLLQYAGTGTPFYVIGWADSIQFNGVIQTGLGF